MDPDSIEDNLAAAILLHNFVIERFPQGKYTPTARNSLFIALCDLTLEHHGAIIVLVQGRQHSGSALALLRPLIESCIRAFWILQCTDDAQVDAIITRKASFPALQRCSEAVSEHFATAGHPGLFSLAKSVREQLHGFTHSGIEQLQHRFTDQLHVKPTYPPKTIAQLLKTASMWLAMAAIAQVDFIEGSQTPDSHRFSDKFIELFGDLG